MDRVLSFKNLPFTPVVGQVIYIENSYNEILNDFINNNYEWLKSEFSSHDLEFCYLPLLAEEVISYNAPYINYWERRYRARYGLSLVDYLKDDTLTSPSLVFGLENPIHDANGNILLQVLPIDINCCTSLKSLFLSLVKEIELRSYTYSHRYKFANRKQKSINEESEDILFRIVHNDADKIFDSRSQKASEEHDDVSFKIFYCKDADSLFDSQSQILVDEIKQRIDALRNRGVNTMFLYDLIDEEPHLSRLLITRDFRIFLVDYNNIEIKLSLLPKAVYFLFLRHLEGIRFKELSDYYSELLKIYRSMNPIGEKSKQEKSIRDITDPTKNSINEKCSRIHEAFVSVFDERLAKYYCVSGNRGEAKRILLDKSMIIWET